MSKELIKDITERHRTFKIDFGSFVYIEKYKNNRFLDCFFALHNEIFPDGTLKSGALRYFYSPMSRDLIDNDLTRVDKSFTHFDKLYFVRDDGEIVRIDGELAINCDYQIS